MLLPPDYQPRARYSLKTAAADLSLSIRSVYNLIEAGELEKGRDDFGVTISVESFIGYVNRQRAETEAVKAKAARGVERARERIAA